MNIFLAFLIMWLIAGVIGCVGCMLYLKYNDKRFYYSMHKSEFIGSCIFLIAIGYISGGAALIVYCSWLWYVIKPKHKKGN